MRSCFPAGRPFASKDLRTLLGDFVRLYNATESGPIDIKHTITQFESVVLSGAAAERAPTWAARQQRRRPRQPWGA